jgi:hypothetical protein
MENDSKKKITEKDLSTDSNPAINDKFRIIRYFKGDISKKYLLTRILPAGFGIYLFGLLIANLFYPGVYDWRYMVISELGNAEANPIGYYFNVIPGLIMGIFLIPLVGYITRHLSVICRGTAFVGGFFFLLGLVCLVALGLTTFIPNLPRRTHENLAMIAFVGLLFGIFFWGFPIIKDHIRKFHGLRQFNFKVMIVGFCMMWFIIFGAGAGTLYISNSEIDFGWVSLDWLTYNPPPPIWASLALWEWALVISLLFYLVLLVYSIPEEVQSLK